MMDCEMVRVFSDDTKLAHVTILFGRLRDETLPPAELLSLVERFSSTPIIVELVPLNTYGDDFVDITTGRRLA
jgi:hypothetical protein